MNSIQEFTYDIDVTQTLLWQYNEATNLTTLINDKQYWLVSNYTFFWMHFYNTIFYLWNPLPSGDPTAFNDFGCAVWAIILGIPLAIVQEDDDTEPYFMFDNYPNFDNAPFTSSDSEYIIPLELRIVILKLRYFQLITRGAVPEINAFLKDVLVGFQGYTGQIYVIDNHDMTITYVFTDAISTDLYYILETYDILPRPAAVGVKIIIEPDLIFGFDSPINFDNGPFVLEI
jgi:hypothetical protein